MDLSDRYIDMNIAGCYLVHYVVLLWNTFKRQTS